MILSIERKGKENGLGEGGGCKKEGRNGRVELDEIEPRFASSLVRISEPLDQQTLRPHAFKSFV